MYRMSLRIAFRIFLMVALLVLLEQSGFAASRNVANTTTETVSTPGHTDVSLDIGFGLPILPNTGETGFGFNFGVLARTDFSRRLLLGGDLGLHFWGKILSAVENSTGLQVLPTAIYELSSSSTFVPYMGLAAGPYIFFSPGTRVDFALLFRPGFNWYFSRNVALNVEAKFGELGAAFIVLPVSSLLIQL